MVFHFGGAAVELISGVTFSKRHIAVTLHWHLYQFELSDWSADVEPDKKNGQPTARTLVELAVLPP